MTPSHNHCVLAGWLPDWSAAWLAEWVAGWLLAPCPHAERARLVPKGSMSFPRALQGTMGYRSVCEAWAEKVTVGLLEGFARSSNSAVHQILAPSHVRNESVRKVVILN